MSSPARRTYSKRNRPTRACLECTRRKQKCDRSKPCRACVVRGAEDHCVYENESRSGTPIVRLGRTPGADSTRPNSFGPAVPDSSIIEEDGDEYSEQELSRLGYADKGDHALSALSELLHHAQRELQAPAAQASCLPKGLESEYWALVDTLPGMPLVQL